MTTDKTGLTRREAIVAAGVAAAASTLAVPAAAAEKRRSRRPETRVGASALEEPDEALVQGDDTKQVGVALVGGAHIHTPQYAGALKGRKGVKIMGVWDHDAARAARWAKDLSCKTITDLKEVWSDPETAAVVICSETNRHHDLVLAAAHAKKHLFVEKPMGITARESFDMAAAIERANLLFTTGYFMRTSPQHLFLREQAAKGSFGKVTRVRGSNCHSGSLGGWFDGEYRWMADPKIAGVGAFGDLGTHALDILMWLFGPVETITADIKIVTNRYPGCDESGEALIKFQNGVTGTLAAGWVDVNDPVSMEISGTEGHAVIVRGQLYFMSSKVANAKGREPWTELPAATPPPIQQFFDALEGKPHDTLVKPMEAAARVAVMEAAYQGARTQSWVKVAQG